MPGERAPGGPRPRSAPDLYAYLRLAACAGARRSQLLALRWADIDIPHASAAFTRALVEGPDRPVLRPTKSRRPYRVAIDTETLAAIAAHKERAAYTGRGRYVFSTDGGLHPWKPNHVTKRFISARRSTGLEHFRLHDLRHFMATEMLAAGVPIVTVSQRLSHARCSTTLNVYAVTGGDQAAVETLAGILTTAGSA